METNSLLMESGEKYMVLISKQYAEYLKVMENIPQTHVFSVLPMRMYVICTSSYIKKMDSLAFFLYILILKYSVIANIIILLIFVCLSRINTQKLAFFKLINPQDDT